MMVSGVRVLAGAIAPATLAWQPRLSPLACGLLIAAACFVLVRLHSRMTSRMSPHKAAILLVPKILIMLLLLLVVLNPSCTSLRRELSPTRLLVLLDRSGSMDVRETGRESRRDEALDLLAKLEAELPGSVTVETRDFDTELYESAAIERSGDETSVRETDLGSVLLRLANLEDISSYSAMVLMTDGGDERLDSAALPPVPLHIVGIGKDPSIWNDTTIQDIDVPDSVEKDARFDVVVDVLARTGGAQETAEGLTAVPAVLEHQVDDAWQKVDQKVVSLVHKRARLRFEAEAGDAGLVKYRVRLDPRADEMSILNNTRVFGVDVRRRDLHVLFYTSELGAGFKMLRSELVTDPGLTFTALFRTIGERYTVQGERLAGDETLSAGFPASADILDLFDCVFVGSFPFESWTAEQVAALTAYLENGGAVVFLGGEESFGEGGYTGTPFEALFPWHSAPGRGELIRGTLPVTIPASAADHPFVSGIEPLIAAEKEAVVESANRIASLKPGAALLMSVSLGGRPMPLAAVQRYGKGSVLALGSNTFWKWARKGGVLKDAYGQFWRQAVRGLSAVGEGERFLSVAWDKDRYQPGDRAVAEVAVSGGEKEDIRVTAVMESESGAKPFPVNAVQGQPGVFRVRTAFGQRGTHRFTLTAYTGDRILETVEKVFQVGPMVGEGANLEVDHVFLEGLTERGSGLYVRPHELDRLVEHLKLQNLQRIVVSNVSWSHGTPWFAVLFIGVLVAEWVLRRRNNLF